MDGLANEDGKAPIDDFASFLCQEEPDVFRNVSTVKRLLELADRRFRDGNDYMDGFMSPCTHDIEGYCWTFSCHHRLNTVLMPRGIEIIALHENALALQTLDNTEDLLTSPNDLLSMCVCIWLLRAHSCIFKVVLNVATVARFHVRAFWRLLCFNTDHLEKVELRGLLNIESHLRIDSLFASASKLTELIMVDIPLNNEDVSKLCHTLLGKKRLQSLVLKHVGMTTEALQLLRKAIQSCSHPISLELREKIPPCEAYEIAVASLLDAPISKLCLETPCNWRELFKRLHCNKSLSALDVVDCDSLMFPCLNELADALLINSTLRSLTLVISIPPMNACVPDPWRKFTRSIGLNRGLKSLHFASSIFCEKTQQVASLAEAIAVNQSLVELSVEGCTMTGPSLLRLLIGLSQNKTMKTLRLGFLREIEEVSQHLFKHVSELDLGERVDVLFVLKSDWLLTWPGVDSPAMPFRRVKALRMSALERNDILNFLHRSLEALTSLRIEHVAGVSMSSIGAKRLADLFAKSNVLAHVKLLFDADAGAVVTLLDGLASSKSIYSVMVGCNWQLSDEVAVAFEKALRKNSSIAELTVWQCTRLGFEQLKTHLRFGVEHNRAISEVRLLYGVDKKESHDWALLALLVSNRVLASWVRDITLGYSMNEHSMSKCAYAFRRLETCDNFRAILRHATGLDDEELTCKIVEANKRTRHLLERPFTKKDGKIGLDDKVRNALRSVNKDFVEEVMILFKAL